MNIIQAISAKLEANKDLVEKAKFGRITWRVTSDGKIEVKLQPEI